MSSANVILVKTAVVITVFCLAECAAGSCLKYGHSCWGGHGKRNGGNLAGGLIRIRDETGPGDAVNTRWYLSRLVQTPADLKFWQEQQQKHNLVTRNLPNRHIQNESEVDSDFTKRTGENVEEITSDSQPEEETDEVVLMEDPPASFGQKLRLYKLMKKSAETIK